VAEPNFDPLLSETAAGEMWCERRHVSLSVRVPRRQIAIGGITQDHQHIDALLESLSERADSDEQRKKR
jgi:hypothetical protein